jgi:hypothetical protein
MENKLQIIETTDYILAVSDEEIKAGDYLYFWNGQSGIIHKLKENQSADNMYGSGLKIIAYQPKNNAPELDLPLLPEISVEDDVNLKAQYYAVSTKSPNREAHRMGYVEGYKAATKVYSEEDLRKAFEAGMYFVGEDKGSYEQFIQSLKQPKTPCFPSHCLRECSDKCLYPNKTPKWFVAETEDIFHSPSPIGMSVDTVIKTTTIKGKTYLVGTYLFE